MSYNLMVFNQRKVPCEFGQLRPWFHTHMEEDVLPEKTPAVFCSFWEKAQKLFPPMDQCPENRFHDACDYEVHEDFIYMCFAYSAAEKAHDTVKRLAKAEHLGFWEVSPSFDRTFPVTLPTDRWPMILEAGWISHGRQFVYHFEEVQKVIRQMKKVEQSSLSLTDRQGNYIQAGGFLDAFLVEVRTYTGPVTWKQLRADQCAENSVADALVSINNFQIQVPKSQILSQDQVCRLFLEFTEETLFHEQNLFWKTLDL